MIDVIVMYIFLFISLLLTCCAARYHRKISLKASKNQKLATNYGGNLVSGIVAGVIVLVLDRIITQIFSANWFLVTKSIKTMIFSVAGIIIMLFFNASLLIFLVLFIVYQGMKKW